MHQQLNQLQAFVPQLEQLAHTLATQYNQEANDHDALCDRIETLELTLIERDQTIAELEAARKADSRDAELAEQLAEATKQLRAREQELETARNDLARKQAVIDDAQRDIRDWEQKVKEATGLINRQQDELEALLAKHNEEVEKASAMIVRQGNELQALANQRNQEVSTANTVITDLEKQLGNATGQLRGSQRQLDEARQELRELRQQNKEYKALNPAKLVETNKDQKAKLSEKNTLIRRLEGKCRNLERECDRLEYELERQNIGEWRFEEERVVPYLDPAMVASKYHLEVDRNFQCARWWMHQSGLQLLIAYDANNDQLVACNPMVGESLREPTQEAKNYMLKTMRKEYAQSVKRAS